MIVHLLRSHSGCQSDPDLSFSDLEKQKGSSAYHCGGSGLFNLNAGGDLLSYTALP